MKKTEQAIKLISIIKKNIPYLTFGVFVFAGIIIYSIYKSINQENIVECCKGFFLVNVGGANGLFGLGRSDVFVMRFPNQQKRVYQSGVAFLCGAMLALISLGTTYISVAFPFSDINFNVYSNTLTFFLASILLGGSVFCTFIGIFKFLFWLRHGLKLYKQDMNEELEMWRKKYD